MIGVKIIKKPKTTGSAGGITTVGTSYAGMAVKESAHAARADLAERAKEADHARSAYTLDEDSPMKELFISKIADDIAHGHITFEQGLTALGRALFKEGASFGEFSDSLFGGTGAGIDRQGNAEFESVRVRSYMEVAELLVNRLAAIEGDQLLTEGDTIDSLTVRSDGTYDLYLHPKWDGYFTAQAKNNVLKGIVNTLTEGSGEYYTSWMRVNSVDTARNMINVSLYADGDVPGGRNYPPRELMRFARWGNQTDERRQSCLYLSSTEGRIVKLTGVTKPIIDKSNYGATFGTPPEWLKEAGLPLVENQDYVYVRGLVAQDIIRMDYQGKPIVTYVDRGIWDADEEYYSETRNPVTGVYETSDVWYGGCKYRCMKTGIKTPPSWNAPSWALIEGNVPYVVSVSRSGWLRNGIGSITLTATVIRGDTDITGDLYPSQFSWRRESSDAEKDAAWNRRHKDVGNVITLTAEDVMGSAVFTCDLESE